MSPSRLLQFRRNQRELSAPCGDIKSSVIQDDSSPPKQAPAIDRYLLLRLRQSPGAQAENVVDFQSEHSRITNSAMSSQF